MWATVDVLHCIAEWSKIEPLTYLGPFLEVIRSPETSGPITGVALTSVRRLLNQYLFGEGHLMCSLQELSFSRISPRRCLHAAAGSKSLALRLCCVV